MWTLIDWSIRTMKTKSAKAKGRRLQDWVAKKIGEITGGTVGKDKDIVPRIMGQSGVDIHMVPKVLDMFPFSIECKNAETWHLQQWIKQAKDNELPVTDWMLFIKKNGEKPVVIMDAERFFDYWGIKVDNEAMIEVLERRTDKWE